MANSPYSFRQPEPRRVPRDWDARTKWRHDVERTAAQETMVLANIGAAADNLLDGSGDYTGTSVTVPGPASRARLSLSCNDEDVKVWLQRSYVGGWRDEYSLSAGNERAVTLPTHSSVRVRIDAATGSTATSYRLELRRTRV